MCPEVEAKWAALWASCLSSLGGQVRAVTGGGGVPWGASGLCIVWHKNGNTVAEVITHWRCNAVFSVLNDCLLCVVLGGSCMGRWGGGGISLQHP